MSLEDFRRKLQRRPQDIRTQQAAEAAKLEQQRIEAEQRAALEKLQQKRSQAEQRQQRIAILQEVYETLGIRTRLQTLAETIGSQISQTIEEPTPGKQIRIRYDIPYRRFSARVIIPDPDLSGGGSYIGQGIWSSIGHGQKLDSTKNLTDSLGISFVLPQYRGQDDGNILLNFSHTHWEERELSWSKLTTKIFSGTRGWVPNDEIVTYVQLQYINGAIMGCDNFEELLDNRFLQLYDCYLKANGQI